MPLLASTGLSNKMLDTGSLKDILADGLIHIYASAPADIPQRRETYRHGDLRRALLDAGVALAREGGPAAVVLREATRRAGVVPNAAYRPFANRDDLFDAVRGAALGA